MEDSEGDTNGLRHELARVLPDYMMPSWFIALEQLPLNASGKVDGSRLPAPGPQRPGGPDLLIEPATDVQRAMYAIWSDVLGVERFSIHANFFDLGGHSLLGITLAGRIREQLNVELPLRRLFEHPTVAALAECVVAASADAFASVPPSASGRYLFELNSGSGIQPVFFLPGGVGGDEEFLVYARLVHLVGGGYRFFGLRAPSADGVEQAHRSTEEMARAYLEDVRRQQPRGPYRLVGNCIGGVLAFEIARQLEAMGETIGALVLMDTDYPTPQRYARHRWTQVREHLKRRANVSHYLSRVSHHRDRLAALEWSEKLRYLRGRAVVVAGRAAGSIDAPEVAQDVRQTYIGTLRQYVPKKFGGAAALILSQEQQGAGTTSGWSEVIGGGLTTLSSPGNHHTYVRDHVKLVAQQLRDCLDRSASAAAFEDGLADH